LHEQGISNQDFFIKEAIYNALAGDLESSLDYVDKAVTQGAIVSSRMAFGWPALQPLEGDPRFEAIQTKMIEHLNSERQKLGLEPATI
jgi:hypothetical protein